MVIGDEQQVLVIGEAHEGGVHQRATRHVEGVNRFLAHEPLGFGVARGGVQGAQVDDGQRQSDIGLDALDGLPFVHGEVGAKHLVPLNQRVEGLAQGLRVEIAGELESPGDVEGGSARIELVEEPETLLGEGEGQRL